MESKESFFNRLIDENIGAWRATAYRILNDPNDTDDAVQEALFKAWKKFGDLRETTKVAGWIYRIVVNESYNILRRRSRRGETELNLDVVADKPRKLADSEGGKRLEQAISALPKIYRETIQLAVLEEVSTEEAGIRLGCSPSAVYQRIYKAKSLLSRMLSKEDIYG